MRNEDASQAGLTQAGSVNARDDADHLAANNYGPATGNTITGTGTITGATGVDLAGSGAKITAIDGAGGHDDSFSRGHLEVEGKYGTLTIDAEGNYSYVRHPGTPAGVSDVFTYTLANKAGASDTAKLIINIGDVPMLQNAGNRVVPGADGTVVLPAGVELSDVRVVGRDLVVTLPDGSTMVIVDGAVFVPQLVIDGVELPASNLASLLIGSEPKPAAGDLTGNQQSSGGNFEVPVQPLDPGVPLGDLLPPTELNYTPPKFEEIGQAIKPNEAPLIIGSTVNVSEEGLQNGLPDDQPGPPQDTTNLAVMSGNVVVSDPDGDPLTVTLGTPLEGLTSHGVAVTWSLSADGHQLTGSAGGTTVVTIVIANNGAYTVTLLQPIDHPNGGGENLSSINVPVTASDGKLSAIGNIVVNFEDDSPNASAARAGSGITIDETAAGTPAGFPLVATSAAAMIDAGGAFGADGPAASGATSYGLTLTGNVASLASGLFTSNGHQAITLVQTNATTITGTYGANQVAFTLVINANGTVTYTQNVPLDHVTDGSSADALNDTSTPITLTGLVNATVTLTDYDGDSASAAVAIGDRIQIFDDGPSIGRADVSEPNLTVDETNLAVDASASFAGLFTGAYGADGAGSTSYALAITAGPSGLVDVATGEAVNLVMNGGVVEGRSAVTNQLVFTVSVNGSAVVTLDQLRAVAHTPDTGPDQPTSLSSDSLVRLVATITDGDGDSASASANIGSNLVFKDDAPSIGLTSATEPNLTVDETNLGVNASASFAGLFTSGNYGADGAGSTSFKVVTAVNGTDSGLIDVATGQHIYLYNDGAGGVIGRVGSGGIADPAGVAAFTVTVDGSGVVTLDQIRALAHTPDAGPDQNSATITDSAIQLVATIVDKDGDAASASVNIGSNLNMKDDAPTLGTPSGVEPTITVDETNLAVNASASFAGFLGAIGAGYGADGAGTTAYTLGISGTGVDSGLIDVATGQHIYLYMSGSTVVGRVGSGGLADPAGAVAFQVTVDGSGVVTLDQVRALAHTPDAGPDQPVSMATDSLINLKLTVTDKDGDAASSSVNIASNLVFKDDAPSIGLTSATEPNLTVDETNLGVNASASFAGLFTSGNYGADGAGSTSFKVVTAVNGTDSGLIDVATGQHIYLYNDGAGGVIGRVGSGGIADPAGVAAFTVTVDGSGVVTLDQIRALAHTPDAGPDQNSATITDSAIQLVATIVDKDGDAASASVNIGSNLNMKDDAPTLGTPSGVEPTITVDETNLAVNASASFAGFLGAIGAGYGADGAGTTAYTLGISGTGVDSGLIDVATGQHIYLYMSGSTVVGRVGSGGLADPAGAVAFQVTVDGSGVVTLDQVRALAHTPDAGPDQPVSMATDSLINLKLTVTDKDGDAASSSVNIASNLVFKDDAPSIGLTSATEPNLTVDETNLGVNASASFAGLFTSGNYGADGAGSTSFKVVTAVNGTDSGLIDVATGQHIYLYNDGAGGVIGRVGSGGIADPAGVAAFTVTVDGSGVVTLDQIRALAHTPDAGPDQNSATITDSAIQLVATIVDKDGDAASASVNIGSNLNMKDDAPSIGLTTANEPNLVVDETNLAIDASASFAGLFTSGNYGADGAGTTGYAVTTVNGTDSGLIDTATLQHIYLYNDGAGGVVGRVGSGGVADPAGAVAFAVTVNGSGVVTLDQQRAIYHTPDAGPDQPSATITDSAIKLVATITDKDGDAASASVNIGSNLTMKDDAPSISTNPGLEPTITVDETNLATDASASFAGLFGAGLYGADGAGTSSFTLATVNGTDSGLIDTATLQHIYLYNNGSGGVVGRVGSGGVADPAGAIAFVVTVDNSAVVTLDQQRAIYHSPDAGPDQPSATITDSAIKLIGTVTDKDGDTASATINIGSNLIMKDDAPSIGLTTASEPNLVVDETNLAADNSASFAGLFTSGNYGADGAGTTAYAVTTVNGTDSGLIDTATLQHIYLYNDGAGGVVGRVGSGGVANPAGAIAFAVTVNGSGVVTLDQQRAIYHSPDAGPDQNSATITDSAIKLVATITDKDGDSASASVNIGANLNMKDDAPSIGLTTASEPNLVVDETNLATDNSASFAGLFTAGSFGADGAGSKTYAVTTVNGTDSGLIDTATLQHIYLYSNGLGGVVGRVGSGGAADPAGAIAFAVTVDGSGVVTLDQQRAIYHSPDAGPDQNSATITDSAIKLVATIVDKDGDAASASVNIGSNLNMKDDAPTLGTPSGVEPTITVDETNLAVNASASFAGFLGAIGAGYGADGAGTTAYTLGISGTGVDSGLIDVATGQHIYLYMSGSTVVGRVGSGGLADPAGAVAFQVTVDGSGVVTLDQVRALAHTPDAGPDQPVSMATDSLINLKLTVTDKDGDAASSSVNIASNLVFKDDAPSAVISTTGVGVVHDETPGVQSGTGENDIASVGTFNVANAGDDPHVAGTGAIGYARGTNAIFGGASVYGADGAGSTVISLDVSSAGVFSGLQTTEGVNIYLFNESGVIVGRVGADAIAAATGQAAFAVRLNGSNQLEMAQFLSIKHTNTGSTDEFAYVANGVIVAKVTVTDADGDVSVATQAFGGNVIGFQDDAGTLGTIQNGTANNNPASAHTFGSLNFAAGADGPGTQMTITANTGTAKSGGHLLVTNQVGNVLTAYQDIDNNGSYDPLVDNVAVFTVTINPTGGPNGGTYDFDLITALDPTVVDVPIGGSSAFGAGPTQGQTLTGGGQNLSVVSGYKTGGTFNEATWLSTGVATGLTLSSVNGSTAGWGIANNGFEGTDEFFNWDFGTGALDTQGGVFTPPGGVSLPAISYAVFDFINYSPADDIKYVVHFTDGTFVSGDIPASVLDGSSNAAATNWTFSAPVGKLIADIEMYSSGAAPGKVDLVSVGVTNTSLNNNLSFSLQLTDGDGDPTATQNWTINVANGNTPSTASPIVLDMNGDGVHFLDHSAGVLFDYGNGMEATAWASPSDAILVRDVNGNGTVDGAWEFVFGHDGMTDMEALHAQYGAQLDANDADFTMFALWTDVNSNGVVDSGELMSLAEAGIASIGLVSDGQAYATANGDVEVSGSATYTKTDGSTGTVADAQFLKAAADTKSAETVEKIAANTNTNVLAAAVAAAGFAMASPVAAHSVEDFAALDHFAFGGPASAAAFVPMDAFEATGSAFALATSLMGGVDLGNLAIHNLPSFATGQAFDAGDLGAMSGMEVATQSLLAATDSMSGHMAMPTMATDIVMPGADALMAMSATGFQQTTTVEKIVADALHGGNAPSIDALLNALPGGPEIGGIATIEMPASGFDAAVPTWDMGHGAAFTFGGADLITSEALALHHDAIQPVVNG